MFNIHDWILINPEESEFVRGFCSLGNLFHVVPRMSYKMKECRRMLASMLGMHVAILFLSFVVVLIVVQTLK